MKPESKKPPANPTPQPPPIRGSQTIPTRKPEQKERTAGRTGRPEEDLRSEHALQKHDALLNRPADGPFRGGSVRSHRARVDQLRQEFVFVAAHFGASVRAPGSNERRGLAVVHSRSAARGSNSFSHGDNASGV